MTSNISKEDRDGFDQVLEDEQFPTHEEAAVNLGGGGAKPKSKLLPAPKPKRQVKQEELNVINVGRRIQN